MKKTSIAMCAVLFGALFISNAFANTGDVVATTVDAAAVTTTGEAAATEAVAAETTTGEAVATETTTGTVAAEATTGDVTTGAVATTGDVATGAVAAEATTGDVATGAVATTGEAEVSINDTLHAILDKYFEDNASKFNTAKDRKDFFETVKANINKAAEKARESQKEAFEIIKGALETYEIK